MNIGITRMSTKGQIVIPSEMRKKFKVGDKLMVIQEGERMVIKKMSKADKQLAEDLEFARRTEEAWKQIQKGEYEEATIEEMKKW